MNLAPSETCHRHRRRSHCRCRLVKGNGEVKLIEPVTSELTSSLN